MGAKVIITSNIDVSYGLCNGASATIQDFITVNNQVVSIMLKLDSDKAGEKAKQANIHKEQYPGCIEIKRIEVVFTIGSNQTVSVLQKATSCYPCICPNIPQSTRKN